MSQADTYSKNNCYFNRLQRRLLMRARNLERNENSPTLNSELNLIHREVSRISRKRRLEILREKKKGRKQSHKPSEVDCTLDTNQPPMLFQNYPSLQFKTRGFISKTLPCQSTASPSNNKPEVSVKDDSGSNQAWDFGPPTYNCKFCGAYAWYEERVGRTQRQLYPNFGLCCLSGKVRLPFMQEAPEPLRKLMDPVPDSMSAKFQKYIRMYNSMFAMTSLGGKINHDLNKGKGPYVFQLNGQNHHKIGSLLPIDESKPRFIQLYICDTENEVLNRLSIFPKNSKCGNCNKELVQMLIQMLDQNNVLVKFCRMARDRFKNNDYHDVRLKLIGNRSSDSQEYNLPIADEVAALIVGDSNTNDVGLSKRDIVVENKGGKLQRISELHPSYMALQYPLLFPYGEDGYRKGILYNLSQAKNTKVRREVTIREYYAFRIQQRPNERNGILLGGKLYHQFLVDAWTTIEQNRLNWIRNHQPRIRSDLYSGLYDAFLQSDTIASRVGQMFILPSTYNGGPRYKIQNYQDAMAICRWAGYPGIFMTFTCNSNWPEIRYFLEIIRMTKPSSRPEVIARVFNIKLQQLIRDVKDEKLFGRVIAVVYTIEFQKRGLPHAHILFFIHPEDHISTSEQIDEVISAEIPDKQREPEAYEAVKKYMVHGPCGSLNKSSPCMQDNKCTKHYPRKLCDRTTIDENGFPIYRRRDTKHTIELKGNVLDNSIIVPYNKKLLVKYQAHINVEWCNRSRSIKYLFKYINKSSDKASAVLVENVAVDNTTGSTKVVRVDEIKAYLDCRYVSAAEASWRILKFKVQYKEPAVERLSFHLENEQPVYFGEKDKVGDILNRKNIHKTMFTEWMEANKIYEDARNLRYIDFPEKFVWKDKLKVWKPRKGKFSIGRIYFTHPSSGEKYYLRMLLNKVRGCTSFEDIRTHNGIVYKTYKEACYAHGLLGEDKEWHDCIHEAARWASPPQLRQLFATMILHCDLIHPGKLWDKYWDLMCEDVQYTQRTLLKRPDLVFSDRQIKNYGLAHIEDLLKKNGRSLHDIKGMPKASEKLLETVRNQLIAEEMSYNRDKLHKEYINLYKGLNTEQLAAFDEIMNSVEGQLGEIFFVYGHGGTGKTYLWKTLVNKIRSEGKIALAVASSGIASLLLPKGRTAHSRFHIPLSPLEGSTCGIKQGTPLAGLLKQTSIIIWDEAPMAHKHTFESLDKTLKDILKFTNEDAGKRPFGGMTVVFGGDFRQILPVVPKGGREDIITASIKKSYLWDHIKVLKLTQNMRLHQSMSEENGTANEANFANWILDIGNGKNNDESGESWVDIPSDILVEYDGNAMEAVVKSTYLDLHVNLNSREYIMERAILAPTNDVVNEINEYIMASIPGEEVIYKSADSVCKGNSSEANSDVLYPEEFLNTLQFPGLPNHELKLKVGVPVMLLRNIDQSIGLCNGTRLVITKLHRWYVEAINITPPYSGSRVVIPRTVLSPSDTTWPFTLKRRQFPLAVCFAMTINKSQGQSLKHVGLFLSRQVFCHGQFYVAISRVTSRKGLKIIIADNEAHDQNKAKNIVYPQIFQDI